MITIRLLAMSLLFSAALEMKEIKATNAMKEPLHQEQAEQAVTLAKQTLHEQAQIALDKISVQSVQAVDWPDSSLGCPQPGMMYAQVITPGFKIVLTAQSKPYPLHLSQQGRAVLCANSTPSANAPKMRSALAKVALAKRAQEKLAAHLHVDVNQIQVNVMHTAKECGPPVADEANTRGRVDLQHAGKYYTYDAESNEVSECANEMGLKK